MAIGLTSLSGPQLRAFQGFLSHLGGPESTTTTPSLHPIPVIPAQLLWQVNPQQSKLKVPAKDQSERRPCQLDATGHFTAPSRRASWEGAFRGTGNLALADCWTAQATWVSHSRQAWAPRSLWLQVMTPPSHRPKHPIVALQGLRVWQALTHAIECRVCSAQAGSWNMETSLNIAVQDGQVPGRPRTCEHGERSPQPGLRSEAGS